MVDELDTWTLPDLDGRGEVYEAEDTEEQDAPVADDAEQAWSIPDLDGRGNPLPESASAPAEGEEPGFSQWREAGVQGGMSVNRGIRGIVEAAGSALTGKKQEAAPLESVAIATSRKQAEQAQGTPQQAGPIAPEADIQSQTVAPVTDALKSVSENFKRNEQYFIDAQDPEYLDALSRITDAEAAADGTLDRLLAGMKATITTPSLILPMAGGVAGTAALQMVGGVVAGPAGAAFVGAADMGASQADETFAELMEKEMAFFAASERFVELVRDHGFTEDEAKVRLAEELTKKARWQAGTASFLINRIPRINKVEDILGGNIVREGAERGFKATVKDIGKAAAGEALTEGLENESANLIGNRIEGQIDPDQDILEDAGASGADVVMGALFGGSTAGVARASERLRLGPEPTPESDIALDVAEEDAFSQEQIDAMNQGVADLENDDTDASDTDTAEPEANTEVEQYEYFELDDDGNHYALDEDGEYLLDNNDDYIITDENGVRLTESDDEVVGETELEPVVDDTDPDASDVDDEPTVAPKSDDEVELERVEQVLNSSLSDDNAMFKQRYGEDRVNPAPDDAPLETRRAVARDVAKQEARLKDKTGESPAEYMASIANRPRLSLEANRELQRQARNLRENIEAQRESDAFLDQMNELAGIEPDTSSTTNSATAESQAIPSEPIVEVTDTNEESNENSNTGDGNEGDAGIDTNLGQRENEAVPGSTGEGRQPDSDTDGNVEQAGAEAEPGQRGQSESRREVRLDPPDPGATVDRGRSLRDQPRSASAAAADTVRQRRVRESADRITQRSNGRVELFEDIKQLDPAVQAQYESRLDDGDAFEIPAFYDPVNNRVYVNPNLVQNENDLKGIVAHEAVHAGLRDVYGNEGGVRDAVLDLVNTFGDADALLAAAQKLNIPLEQYRNDPTSAPTLGDLASIMEEIVARTAQDREQSSAVQKLISAIRDALARLGVNVPYLGRDKADAAVIKMMRDAQRAYDKTNRRAPYTPTVNDRLNNATTEAERNRIVGNIRRRIERQQANEADYPDQLRSLIGATLTRGERAELRAQEDRRIQYLISPRHAYSTWKSSLARERWKTFVNKNLFPKRIVGEFTVNLKGLTEAEKSADSQAVVYLVGAVNKAIKGLNLKTDADRLRLEQMMNAHLADEISPLIHPTLQQAATAIRSAEVTSENAYAYLFKGKAIPKELRTAFKTLMNTKDFTKADLAVAHAFISGKHNPQLPTALREPLMNMRLHLDNHSTKILEQVSDQIAHRVSQLGNELWSKYRDYMAIRAGDPHAENSFAELGEMPASLVSLHNLHDTLSGNLGRYMHRSYRAFDDPDWYDTVTRDHAVMSRGIEALRLQRIDEYESALTLKQQADFDEWLRHGGQEQNDRYNAWRTVNPKAKTPKHLKVKGKKPAGYDKHLASLETGELRQGIQNMLQDAQDKGGMFDLMTNKSTYGAKEMSIMMKRKHLSPIIRELLGEYTDPRVNFTKSSHKMANMIAKQHFLNGLYQELNGKMLFHKSPADGRFNAQIAGKSSSTMNPLNGMRTTKEFRDVLQEWTEPAEMAPWLRNYMKFNGAVKVGKTVYNPGTHMANIGSNVLIGLVNGTLRPKHLMMATRLYGADMFGDTKLGRFYAGKNYTVQQLQDIRTELVKKGVLADSVNAGEVEAMLQDARSSRPGMMDRLMDTQAGAVIGRTDNIVKRQYQWEDDFFKAAAYYSELQDYQKQGMDAEMASIRAAERIGDLWPNYSNIPPLVQGIRRFPLVGSFVSFSSEMIRITFNQSRYIAEDHQNNPKKLAYRMAGGLVGTMGLQLAALTSRMFYGISEDDDDVNRQLFAPWSKYGTIMYMGYDETGAMEYVDLSRFDPWSHFRKMWNVMSSGVDRSKLTRAYEFAIAAGEPFLAPEIVADALTDVARNTRYGISGLEIHNEQDTVGAQLQDIGAYLFRAMGPGFALSAQRFYFASQDDVGFSGKQYRTKDEIYALAGIRKNTINLRVAVGRQTSQLEMNIRSSNSIINAELYDQSIRTEKQLENKFNATIKARERNFNNMLRMIDGFREKGLDEKEIRDQMYSANISKKDVRKLLRGEIPRYNMTDAVGERAMEKATAAAGDDQQLRAQLEERFDYKKRVVRELTEAYYANQ